LVLAGQSIPDPEMLAAGLNILEWLLHIQTHKDGHLTIIENPRWYGSGGEEANSGQQPKDAMNLIDACVDACITTGDKKWLDEAERCFGWFMGRNDISTPIFNFETDGCYDGLEHHGVNENQGAESTISWLISLIRMYESIVLHEMVVKNK